MLNIGCAHVANFNGVAVIFIYEGHVRREAFHLQRLEVFVFPMLVLT